MQSIIIFLSGAWLGGLVGVAAMAVVNVSRDKKNGPGSKY